MSLAYVNSRALLGMDSPEVKVEVHASNGLPNFSIVGLPETSVKESKDRVRSAIINSGFQLPPKRITINLAPADLPKSGSRFDLAIALASLIATEQLPQLNLENYEFYGELGLNGEIRRIDGILPALIQASATDKIIIIPQDNLIEASLIESQKIYGAKHLLDLVSFLLGQGELEKSQLTEQKAMNYLEDISDIRGQTQAKRALEIAASGSHSLLMLGPPGSGKSMLAQRLITLLPQMSQEEALETAAIRSIAGQKFEPDSFYQRKLISPHHTSSAASIIGGGQIPKPGALSLAHNSVLFFDEVPEFSRDVLEALREPLETKQVNISRVKQHLTYPCDILFVAAANPSPSGYFSDDPRCVDTPDQIMRYLKKISGPILDRIDLHLEVPAVEIDQLTAPIDKNAEKSAQIRERVELTQARQLARQGCLNSKLSSSQLNELIKLKDDELEFLKLSIEKLNLSARSYHKILRLALTLADMANLPLNKLHLAEALSLRNLDRLGI